MPTIKQATTDQEGNNSATTVGDATNTNSSSGNKRKNESLAINSNDTKNVIQKVHSGDASTHKQRPSDEDDSSSLDESSKKEISVIDILFPCEGPELAEETLRALASKQGWRFGIGQRNIKVIQRALLDHYDKLVDGVDKLQVDIVAANNGAYSSDSDTDSDIESDNELEDVGKKNSVPAEDAAEEEADDVSFGNGGDESTNGDGLSELGTAGTSAADAPLHVNTPPLFTIETSKVDVDSEENGMEVAHDNGNNESINGDGLDELGTGTLTNAQRNNEPPTTSKSDSIKCLGNGENGVKVDDTIKNDTSKGNGVNNDNEGNGVEDNRQGPSPTNVDADLSGYNNINAKECVGNNNTSMTTMSTSDTIQSSPSSAFTANLRKESETYEDQARSNHSMLPQFQQQQHQLSFPQRQYYDRATLESMGDEELLRRYYQHQKWQEQQRQQQQMHQYYDNATLESLSNEELCRRYQQRQRQQWQMRMLALQQQQQQQQRQQTYQPPVLNQQQQSSYGDGRLRVGGASPSNEFVPQCCETEPEKEIDSEGRLVKQQCQGGCGRMLERNHFTKNQWERKGKQKCLECLLPHCSGDGGSKIRVALVGGENETRREEATREEATREEAAREEATREEAEREEATREEATREEATREKYIQKERRMVENSHSKSTRA